MKPTPEKLIRFRNNDEHVKVLIVTTSGAVVAEYASQEKAKKAVESINNSSTKISFGNIYARIIS